MGTINKDEIDLIAACYGRPPRCTARTYGQKILYGTATAEDLVAVDVFIRQQNADPCVEAWALRRLYEDHLLRTIEADRQQRDPTTQELNRQNATHQNSI